MTGQRNKLMRRLPFWLWLLVPPLLAVALQLGLGAYGRRTLAMLNGRRQLISVVPEVMAQAAAARNVVGAFTLTPEQGDSIVEHLGDKLHKLNSNDRQSGFRIVSLSVDKSGVEDGLSVFRVALNGVGDLAATARFLHAVQTTERLMNVDHVRLISQKGEDEHGYTVELSFRYLVVPP